MGNVKWERNSVQKTERNAEHWENTFMPNERQEEEHRRGGTDQTDETVITTSTEGVATEILENFNSKNAPDFDLFAGVI